MNTSACIVFFSIALGVMTSAQAQTALYSGRIVDGKALDPLPFASISIKGKAIGTMANEAGDFDFFISPDFLRDTLMISHLGYKSFSVCIADLKHTDIIIRLAVMPVVLQEVTITENKLSARAIVSKAVRNMKLNCATEPYCLEGFFREIEEENGRYVYLTEAAVDIYDRGMDGKRKKLIQESVHIREMRRSLRFGERTNDNIGYALADLIENNDVRYNRGMLDTVKNSFDIDTVTSYQGRVVYGISVENETDHGHLYIDAETYGVLKIRSERKSRDAGKLYYFVNDRPDSLKMGRKWFVFSVEFEPYNGKLYAKRMHESELNEMYYAHNGKVKTVSIETLEFITTAVREWKVNKQARQLRYGLAFKDIPYNEAFWKNSNTLKLTPLNKKLISDLEREVSLQKQFGTKSE